MNWDEEVSIAYGVFFGGGGGKKERRGVDEKKKPRSDAIYFAMTFIVDCLVC